MRWTYGDVIVRREILNDGRPWAAHTEYVVEDSQECLVTYLPTGTPFGFGPGPFPTPDGRHPWAERSGWEGHGRLSIQRPGDDHAVFVFWHGPGRSHEWWYINIQETFRRTPIGYDTQDLELDIVVGLDGTVELKDAEMLPDRIAEGRFHRDQVDAVERIGEELVDRLLKGDWWWDTAWAQWTPDPVWRPAPLPSGWIEVPSSR